VSNSFHNPTLCFHPLSFIIYLLLCFFFVCILYWQSFFLYIFQWENVATNKQTNKPMHRELLFLSSLNWFGFTFCFLFCVNSDNLIFCL
jgi:hypothetical protein